MNKLTSVEEFANNYFHSESNFDDIVMFGKEVQKQAYEAGVNNALELAAEKVKVLCSYTKPFTNKEVYLIDKQSILDLKYSEELKL